AKLCALPVEVSEGAEGVIGGAAAGRVGPVEGGAQERALGKSAQGLRQSQGAAHVALATEVVLTDGDAEARVVLLHQLLQAGEELHPVVDPGLVLVGGVPEGA